MTILRSVDLACEANILSACHDRTKIGAATVEDVRKLAFDLGWKAVAVRVDHSDAVRMADICPACAKAVPGAV